MTKLCNSCEYLRYCARSGIEEVGCDRYKKDMTTNEEWFCNLSTEEKAKTIVCLEVNALHKWKKGLVESDVAEIKRWLGETRMKCPRCNGDGSVPYHIADDLFDETNCPLCGGSGEVMTEQEYIQTCTTEQLADVFFEYRYANATPRQKLWMSASEKCIKTDIVEWLKKPHTPKE